ncbi:putative binding protein component of ABC transporter [Pseudomonas psychrotolerans L19]|uniref:ABC transporter substrate-binding protein n=1 Tax=Pseudomonas TaxID=286 RepID=UPI00023A3DB2|nr:MULTISPECIES: ABC transporter substrate-binding protein [Pseudomonas]EHK71933.1 putative binding protein component of ABC transporter [Pseudomonas psychrotolerans L19]MBA1183054.1 ABC transporter substrate-binding protein [Pseudomonas psychrotolerans]MBA1210601.1 ABC transporter substrate-binding protein [Pseudomonas psychrotolerans]TCQ83789.1 glycine betaine/proline transport system substrate-binding protein [Pseudomonas sp. JUb52]
MPTAFPRRSLLAAGLSLGLLAAGTAQADSWCASKPVKFAGVNWESGMLLTELMGFVLQHGYDCKVDSIPGNSITLEQALGNNDIQVFAEEWIGRSEAWNKAAAAGKVVGVGAPIEGATEGWYVPRYLVEGEGAKAPKLKTIADLGQYAELFRDPEEPGKGRFYNCPAGWTCELENTQMLQSYGLSDKYTNFRPGTGPALDAAIVSATKRKQPILTYYWSPTPLLGRVDMVQLKPRDGDAKRIQVQAGLSKPFHDGAPELVAVLSRVNVPIELLNRTLAEQADAKQDAPTAAKALLKAHPELWQAWVTDAAARSKIQAAL